MGTEREKSTVGGTRAAERWNRFGHGPTAPAVAFAWGLAEATLFFVVPDVWIGFLALFGWRAGLRAAAWALAGALVGGALMYGLGAAWERDRSARLLNTVPAVSPAMVSRVEAQLRDAGPRSMLLGPLQGTPYKIYARTAGADRESPLAVLLWSVPARGIRFVAVALVAALAGAIRRRLGQPPGRLVVLYALVWITFYVAYFRSYGW